MNLPMLKNSSGKRSSSVTFAWVSFIFVLVAVMAGLLEDLTIGSFNIKFRMIDASLVLALLGPTFSLYGYRRFVSSRYETNEAEETDFEPLNKCSKKSNKINNLD